MPSQNTVIAIYRTHTEAEAAIKELQETDFDMQKLSVIGKNFHAIEKVVGYYTTGGITKPYGKLGPFWGDLMGSLSDSALFWIPDIGPVAMGGPLVSWIVRAQDDTTVVYGLTIIGKGLFMIGIPKDSIVECERAIKSDKYVVVAHGTKDEMKQAEDILKASNDVGVAIH